jgi:hypothetical protein
MMQGIVKGKDTAELKLTYKDREWRMAKGMQNAEGKGDYPVLAVGESHTGEFTFKITNQDHVTFTDDPFGPMDGAKNPPDFAQQFTVTEKGPKKIVVKAHNANPIDPTKDYPGGVYTYELRFNNADRLDPVITNGGCCKSLLSSGGNMSLVSEPAGVGIALGAIALVVLVAARWRRAAA